MAMNVLRRALISSQKMLFSTSSACKVESEIGNTKTPTQPKPTSSASTEKTVQTDPTKYNAMEYYSYSEYSYYDIDRECVSMRIKQPEAPIIHR